MSAFGVKADMAFCENPLSRSLLGAKRHALLHLHMSASGPKRTWQRIPKNTASNVRMLTCRMGSPHYGEGNETTRFCYPNRRRGCVATHYTCTIYAYDRRPQLASAWRVFPSVGRLSPRSERARLCRGSERQD